MLIKDVGTDDEIIRVGDEAIRCTVRSMMLRLADGRAQSTGTFVEVRRMLQNDGELS